MQNEEKQKKKGFRERYGMRELLERRDLIMLSGQTRATLYGCRRILLYSPCEIRFCIGKKEVSVLGDHLICTCFSAGEALLERLRIISTSIITTRNMIPVMEVMIS